MKKELEITTEEITFDLNKLLPHYEDYNYAFGQYEVGRATRSGLNNNIITQHVARGGWIIHHATPEQAIEGLKEVIEAEREFNAK